MSAGVVHAVIDLDAFASAGLPEARAAELVYLNLASVWANFAKAGISRLLLAVAVESSHELARIRSAIPGANIVVCRLIADANIAERRVRAREPGMLQEKFGRGRASFTTCWNEHVWRFQHRERQPLNHGRRTRAARRARWIDDGPHGD